jgi:excisionase family DNA binding protein
VQAHWYTVQEAARLLGISEAAVRTRISDRSFTALKVGRGWRILLPGEPRTVSTVDGATQPPAPRGAEQLARATESMVTLVRDLQRQNLALAGHIGYLQSQLSRESDEQQVSRQEHDAALRQIAELRESVERYEEERGARKRRWWRRA